MPENLPEVTEDGSLPVEPSFGEDSVPLDLATESLRRIAYHQRILEHHRTISRAREEAILDRIRWHEANLRFAAVRLSRDYGRAMIPLPGGGHVRVAKARGSFILTNEHAAKEYAAAHDCLITRLVETIDKLSLRKKLAERDGALIDPATGDIISWAAIERDPDGLSFSYSIPEGA